MKNWLILTLPFLGLPTLLLSQARQECLSHPSLRTEDSVIIKVSALRINSAFTDFSPQLINNNLYFVSGRTRVTGVEYKDESSNTEITDIYIATVGANGQPAKVRPLPGSLNTKLYEGPFTVTKNEAEMYLTTNSRNTSLLKVALSKNTAEGWSSARPLAFCQDSFSYCHPSLSYNNDTLWFSSNMRGGFGGMDLYYSVKHGSDWSAPVNAGALINSAENEVFPFAGRCGRIYYSSQRGKTGLDLYCRQLTAASEATLLPAPFNSEGDDFGIWVDSTLQSGYFSSGRNIRHGDDVFTFSRKIPDEEGAISFRPKRRFCYSFFEEKTEAEATTDSLEFEWDFGDGVKSREMRTKHCYDKPGDYLVQLNMVQKVSGEIFKAQTSYSLNIVPPEEIVINSSDTASAGECLTFNYALISLDKFAIKQVVWDFGDGKYNTASEAVHVFRTAGNYTVKLLLLLRDESTQKDLKVVTLKTVSIKEESGEKE